jgi:hypothetical protein
MSNEFAPDPKHRKLIQIWIQEEKERLEREERPPQRPVDSGTAEEIQKLLKETDALGFEKIEKQARSLLEKGIEKATRDREKIKRPTQYEREQYCMKFRSLLPTGRDLVWANALENRKDIFPPRKNGRAEIKSGVHNEEGNPDINRVENWAIWAYVWAIFGGSAYNADLYWRYRISVPWFDTSVQPDRRLVVTPMAVLQGYYQLMAVLSSSFLGPETSVELFFWTGTWHWHFTGSSWDPEWTGWRRSFGTVSREITNGNIHQSIDIPYPGARVMTPARFDPPGVHTSPNPRNNYGVVVPFDVVDFYVRPALSADTDGNAMLSYARLDFSLIDVPFVTAEFEEGYLL